MESKHSLTKLSLRLLLSHLLVWIYVTGYGAVCPAAMDDEETSGYLGSADPQAVAGIYTEIVEPRLPQALADAARQGGRSMIREAILAYVLDVGWDQLNGADSDEVFDFSGRFVNPDHPWQRLAQLTSNFELDVSGPNSGEIRGLINAAMDHPKWQATLLRHLVSGQDDGEVFIWAIQQGERLEDPELRIAFIIRATMSTGYLRGKEGCDKVMQYLSDAVARIAYAEGTAAHVLWAYCLGATLSEHTVLESFARGTEEDRHHFLDTLTTTLKKEIDWASPDDLLPHIREARDAIAQRSR